VISAQPPAVAAEPGTRLVLPRAVSPQEFRLTKPVRRAMLYSRRSLVSDVIIAARQ